MPPNHTPSVLIVDDDESCRIVFRKAIAKSGLRVIDCGTADQALLMARENRPDVILLDAHLDQGANGFHLCSKLKGDSQTSGIPILMMSGTLPADECASEAAERGAAGFLVKPFAVGELEQQIRAVVVARRPATQIPKPGCPSPTILWVEDDPEYQSLGVPEFQRARFSVTCVNDLKCARDCLRRSTPDLILLDAGLPDGLGLDFCREIRREHRLARALIVVLTGQKRVWNRGEWLDAGADQCWPKVFKAERIVDLVKGLLRRKAWSSRVMKPSIPGLTIDPVSRVVQFRDAQSNPLSRRELVFFDLLCNAFPDLLPRSEVHEKVLSYKRSDDAELALNTFVLRLRRKLPRALSKALRTLRAEGYRLEFRP